MRAFFIFVMIISVFGKGLASDKFARKIRMNLHPEKLCMSKDGMFFMTQELGKIALNNLHLDERGYYTNCKIAYECTNCHKKFRKCPDMCDHCGLEDMNLVGVEESKERECLTAQNLICMYLQDPSQWKDKIYLCGELTVEGSVDNKGNKSVSIGIEDNNKDETMSWEVEGTVTKREDGDTEAKLEGGFTYKF